MVTVNPPETIASDDEDDEDLLAVPGTAGEEEAAEDAEGADDAAPADEGGDA